MQSPPAGEPVQRQAPLPEAEDAANLVGENPEENDRGPGVPADPEDEAQKDLVGEDREVKTKQVLLGFFSKRMDRTVALQRCIFGVSLHR